MDQLVELVLFSNELTGSIPYSIFEATNLEIIALSDNKIEGHLSSRFDDLGKLRELYVWQNMLTGTVPDDFGNMPILEHFEFNNNDITGEVPSEVCALDLLTLYADCKGTSPQVECACCTMCWD